MIKISKILMIWYIDNHVDMILLWDQIMMLYYDDKIYVAIIW